MKGKQFIQASSKNYITDEIECIDALNKIGA